jgi:hypothetical protein
MSEGCTDDEKRQQRLEDMATGGFITATLIICFKVIWDAILWGVLR